MSLLTKACLLFLCCDSTYCVVAPWYQFDVVGKDDCTMSNHDEDSKETSILFLEVFQKVWLLQLLQFSSEFWESGSSASASPSDWLMRVSR